MRITGISHSPTAFRFLIRLVLLPLTVLNMRYPTNGIMQNAGTFVKIARPRNIPDIKIRIVLGLLSLISFLSPSIFLEAFSIFIFLL